MKELNKTEVPADPDASRSMPRSCWHALVFAICLAAAFGMSHQLSGQATEFGSLNGTVTDQQGMPIAGASVTAVDVATGVTHTATTNTEGLYRIFSLLPARYEINLTAQGFQTVRIAPFKLDVSQTLTQNVTLVVGKVTEQVEVGAQGQLLQTTTVANSTTIESQEINDLPLNGRNYTSLIDLTPGADGTRISGQWGDGNRYVLDGANNTTLLGASSAYVPNLDIIQEFSIDSSSTKAEEGGFLGATVSAATKSGTNQFHGDAWEFGRNNEFVARNPITDPPGIAFPPYHVNQYGATLGGPVMLPKVYNGHNKTFFFFGYQRYTITQQAYVYSQVLTADELNGDFANSLFFLASPNQAHLFDPETTTAGANPTRQPFSPTDVIPPGRVDTLVQSYLKAIEPPPNFTPNANFPTDNRLDLFPSPTTADDYSIRIDHTIGARDTLWGRYSQVQNSSVSYTTLSDLNLQTENRKNLVLDWVHVLTPRLFVESNFAYQLFPFTINTETPGSTVMQGLSGMGWSSGVIAFGLPNFSITGFSVPTFTGVYAQQQHSPFSLNESLSWTRGRHSLKFGVNFSHKNYANVATGGWWGFNQVPTEDPDQSDPGAANTGLGIASALLGLPYTTDIGADSYTEAYSNWAAYAEDTWKLRPNLTIDVGLRYDSFPPPHFTQGMINDWDANNGIWYIGGGKTPPPCNTNPVAPCIPGDGNIADLPYGNMIQVAKYPGIMYPIYDNWGPRLGVSWNFLKNTVVSGGFGIYYDPTSNTTQEDQNTFGQWPTAVFNQNYNAIGSPLTYVDQINAGSFTPITTGVPWGTSGYFWDPQKKDPMSQEWNVSVQQQFGKNLVATIAYVGSHGSRLDMTLDANTAQTPGPGDAAVVNSRRLWPFYGADTHFGTDLGRSNYNALQIKVNKSYSNGVSLLLSYTWAKTLDNNTDAWYSASPQDSYDVNADYGLSNADRPQIFSAAAIYAFPFGRGQRWLQKGILASVAGNWQINVIGSAESGNPVAIYCTGDPANIGNTQYSYDRPNLVGNPHVSHPSDAAWLNAAAFQQPVYAYGNAPRGLIMGPNYQNADMSVLKNIPIPSADEKLSLQLRFEAFNALNLITRGSVDGNSTDNPTFGQIHSIGSTPRQLQFAAKLYF